MRCTKCNYDNSHVIETNRNYDKNFVLRRRECLKCYHRFTTQEAMREPKKVKTTGKSK